ncbi:MAG: hypothetical protein ACU0CY_13395 [Maritimibacter harenae]
MPATCHEGFAEPSCAGFIPRDPAPIERGKTEIEDDPLRAVWLVEGSEGVEDQGAETWNEDFAALAVQGVTCHADGMAQGM